jgi:hypothetical protein
MIDVAVAYNRYKFLGEEFLTWLWYIIETDQTVIARFDNDFVALEVGDRIVLENRQTKAIKKITIKGDEASLDEGILSLKKGAVVTELNLSFTTGELKYQFTIKGESLNISSLHIPKTGLPETSAFRSDEVETAVLEKADLYDKLIKFLENLFAYFIKLRVSPSWQNKGIPQIKKWIQAS